MDTGIFEGLGFTDAEAKVYLALLELGTSAVGPIIEKSGKQSSVVHMTLKKLEGKGFVSVVREGKKSYYQATDPKHFLAYLDEKKAAFAGILPQLLKKQEQTEKKPEATLFRGVRGVKELLYELLDAGGKEHHTFGSSNASLMLGEEWWVRYHRKRAAKGIRAQLLFNESLKFWKAERKYPLAQVRYTKKGFEPLTETIIRNDKVGVLLWTATPIGVLIHNKQLASSYDDFFKIIWEAAIGKSC